MSINKNNVYTKYNGQRGVGLLEIVVVVAILGVVAAIAIINLQSASASARLQQSVRQLASYMEKARVDAVRRHSTTTVSFTSPTNYTVRMDFNSSGIATERSFSFARDVVLASADLPSVTFDWRGRTSSAGAICVTTFSVKNNNSSDGLSVDVSGSGDVTVENQQPSLPNISYSNANSPSSGINSRTAVNGTAVVDNTPCMDVSGEAVGQETGPPGCAMGADKTSVSIRKNQASTASVLLNMSVSSLVVITKPANLTITPTSSMVSASGTTFLISSNNTLRGPFDVTFSSQCGSSLTLRVNVTN